MAEERLQKILARAGVTSRRKAEDLIREGRVTVNGAVAGIGDKADPARDAVKLDGKRVHLPATHRYLLLNKPRAVMSTLSDPEGRPTVMEFVPPMFRKALVPVGRLDFLTEGLLLLTDDGEFAQTIAHPRHGCWKTYEVKVSGHPDAAALDRLRAGILLEGVRTAPCEIEPRHVKARRSPRGERGRRPPESETSWWTVRLAEGRTRQIREMFQRVGHPVQKLRRVAIGPLSDSELPLGAVRELSEREVDMLKRAAGRIPPPDQQAAGRKAPRSGPRQPAPSVRGGARKGGPPRPGPPKRTGERPKPPRRRH